MTDGSGSEGRPPPARSHPSLFDARLRDATLFDLIQFECQRGSLGIVQVSSRGQDGFVFFRDGQVVHATTDRQTGEAALREMLDWQDGAYEACTGVWPDRESISTPWQQLLLEIAQASDERRAAAAGTSAAETTAVDPPPSRPTETTPGPFEWVMFSPDGRVVDGELDSDLPESAAYAVQLASAIGELLALDSFSVLEVISDHGHVLVGRTAEGQNVLAARAARARDLEAVRKRIEP
jgi:hypothetical protein